MRRSSFIAGTSILIGASLITRILGFVYRVMLTRLIGAQGIGLFQMVFPFLSLLLTFVTLGMGVTVSKFVAEAIAINAKKRISKIMFYAYAMTITSSLVLTCLAFFSSSWIARHLFTDPRAIYPFVTLLPVMIIIAISTVLRGYFQGRQQMGSPAIASMIETVIRIISVYFLTLFAVSLGLEYAAAGISLGMLLGEIGACLYMGFQYHRQRNQDDPLPTLTSQEEKTPSLLKAMLAMAMPITLSRILGSVIYALEPIIVTRSLLLAGFTTSAATKAYGEYSGMAIPLLVFPTVFTYSLAVSLIPDIAESIATAKKQAIALRMEQVFKATAIIGLPASIFLLQLAYPLCEVIFHHGGVAPMLAIMAPCGFFLYLQAPLAGILQGMNKAGTVMRNGLIGSISKLGIIAWLTSNPSIGIQGIAWSVTISVIVTTFLHIGSLQKQIGFSIRANDTIKILLATAATSLSVTFLWQKFDHNAMTWQLIFTLSSASILYITILWITGVINWRTLTRLPFFHRLARHR